MEQITIEGYIGKFANLIQSFLFIDEILNEDIRPKNKDNPINSVFWRQGAANGAFVYFSSILTPTEMEINKMVIARLKGDGDSNTPIDPFDYIDQAVIVLEEMGYHIPIPED